MIGFIIALSFIIIGMVFISAKIFYAHYYEYIINGKDPYLINFTNIFIPLLISIMLLIGCFFLKDWIHFNKIVFLFFLFYIISLFMAIDSLDKGFFYDNKRLNKYFIKFFFSILFYPFFKFLSYVIKILLYPFRKKKMEEEEQRRMEQIRNERIEREQKREEEQRRMEQIRNELIKKIDNLIQKSCNFNKLLTQKGLKNKYIVVDTNIFLTQQGMNIVEELIKYNILVIFSGVLDELEKLKEQNKKTEISISRVLNFIKDNIKNNQIEIEYLNPKEEKLYYDRESDLYADKYFAELLNKNSEYFFITWDNSLFIRLYGKFKNKILDPKEFEKTFKNENLINEMKNLKIAIEGYTPVYELNEIKEELESLEYKISLC